MTRRNQVWPNVKNGTKQSQDHVKTTTGNGYQDGQRGLKKLTIKMGDTKEIYRGVKAVSGLNKPSQTRNRRNSKMEI